MPLDDRARREAEQLNHKLAATRTDPRMVAPPPTALGSALADVARHARATYDASARWDEARSEQAAPACPTCGGALFVVPADAPRHARRSIPCPACYQARAQQRAAERAAALIGQINHRWPLPKSTPALAASPWLARPADDVGAVPAARARAAQQLILGEMPSARSLFLYGEPGNGKTRLLAELAVVARERGLSSILRTGEQLREVLHAFPHESERGAARERKERALEMARDHLRHCHLLCLDELDNTSGIADGSMSRLILDILNWRYDHGLTTAVAANHIERLAPMIADRLRAVDNASVWLSGPSVRRYFGHLPPA